MWDSQIATPNNEKSTESLKSIVCTQ
jgi:hypothetical protein